uniref:Uncharacterized protein n=1 Tax=Solanum tuberosum TaxID=4113 RepID=M1D9N6_SOLTU
MDKHPKRVRMHFLDEQSSKLVEHYQQVVFDNLPLYCTYCKHQGHEDDDCRLMIQKNKRGEGNQDDIRQQGDKTNNLEQLQGDARDFLNAKKTENKVSNDTDNASNVNETPNINYMQHLTTKNNSDTRLVLVGQRSLEEELLVPETKVQEGLLVPGPEVQLLNISGKSLADALKTSDKVQGCQKGDTCIISCEDQVGSNAG